MPGTLTITPAPLTITAGNVIRTQSQSDPAFTSTYTGLVNGDSAAVVTGLAYSAGDQGSSIVGLYNLAPYGAMASNYTIFYVPGTITVIPDSSTGSSTGGNSSPTTSTSSILSQVVNSTRMTGSVSPPNGSGLTTVGLPGFFATASQLGGDSQTESDQVVCLKSGVNTARNACSGALILRNSER